MTTTEEDVKDPPETAVSGILQGIKDQVAQLARALPPATASLPHGIPDGDMVVILERRAQLRARAAYLHGLVVGSTNVLRQQRLISFEDYAALVKSVEGLVNK